MQNLRYLLISLLICSLSINSVEGRGGGVIHGGGHGHGWGGPGLVVVPTTVYVASDPWICPQCKGNYDRALYTQYGHCPGNCGFGIGTPVGPLIISH